MESNDARIFRGAAIPCWRQEVTGRSGRKPVWSGVSASSEPLFSVPLQSEPPCDESDALIAALDAALGAVVLRSSQAHRSRGLRHGQTR